MTTPRAALYMYMPFDLGPGRVINKEASWTSATSRSSKIVVQRHRACRGASAPTAGAGATLTASQTARRLGRFGLLDKRLSELSSNERLGAERRRLQAQHVFDAASRRSLGQARLAVLCASTRRPWCCCSAGRS